MNVTPPASLEFHRPLRMMFRTARDTTGQYKPGWSHRVWAILGLLVVLLLARSGQAGGVPVPADIQAQLLSKVMLYARDFPPNGATRVHIVIVASVSSLSSAREAGLLQAAFSREPNIAGIPHDSEIVRFESAHALAADCKERGISIVYLTEGLDDAIDDIRGELEPLHVVTVTAIAEYVRRGIILGFGLEAGRPKVLVHIGQAKNAEIHFSSALLKLATVFK